MSKRLKLVTRSLGAEPGIPEVGKLAEWVAAHRGTAADLTTYRLLHSLIPQLETGIDLPCAGGKFMADRILECLIGVTGKKCTGELGVRSDALAGDSYTVAVQKRGCWCALPAPHLLGIRDEYYNDEEEWRGALTASYRAMLRDMRDAGVAGHVIIAGSGTSEEVAALARQNVVFFIPDADSNSLKTLMEHQHVLAVENDHLARVFELVDEYELRQVIIIDADRKGIGLALSHLDPDQVMVGGYCTSDNSDYWKKVTGSSEYHR